MQLHRILSSLLVAAALVGTPLAASAEPAPVAAQTTHSAKPAAVADAESYAEREKQSPAAAKFEGGGEGIYIGGGALTIIIIVLLIVIIL